jgi:hypothetical protein
MADTSLPDAAPDNTGDGNGDNGGLLVAGLDSLQVGGTPPAQGDTVTLKVEGVVDRVEGNEAYIRPQKVNGKDVPSSSDENQSDNGENDLQQKAEALDSQQGY